MPDFIVEYLLTQVRVARLNAESEAHAREEIKHYHEQSNSEMEDELVIVIKVDKDE